MRMPFAQLLDLICIHQIKEEGYTYRRPRTAENERLEFKKLLMLR